MNKELIREAFEKALKDMDKIDALTEMHGLHPFSLMRNGLTEALASLDEDIKIEGVRELVEEIRKGVYGFNIWIEDLHDNEECEKLITEFIQQREAEQYMCKKD